MNCSSHKCWIEMWAKKSIGSFTPKQCFWGGYWATSLPLKVQELQVYQWHHNFWLVWTVSRGDTCFLCRITHHFYLITPEASYHWLSPSEEMTPHSVIPQHLPFDQPCSWVWVIHTHIQCLCQPQPGGSVYHIWCDILAVSSWASLSAFSFSLPFPKAHSGMEKLHCTLHHLETTSECNSA